MENSIDLPLTGPFETRYSAFLETITQLRPPLHRYCARMTGSVMDGEDVVQEALFEAYRKLDQFDESRPLKPWLFRIAHNRCIDFLRRRGARDEAEATAAVPETILPTEPSSLGIGYALEHLVLTLPPKERACVLLKDIFDYTLEEIAEMVDSTIGGVKAALNRARTKLSASSPRPNATRPVSPELQRVSVACVVARARPGRSFQGNHGERSPGPPRQGRADRSGRADPPRPRVRASRRPPPPRHANARVEKSPRGSCARVGNNADRHLRCWSGRRRDGHRPHA